MWVITLGPFRGKRMQCIKIMGLVIVVALLALLVWQFIDGYFAEPEPEGKQRALDASASTEQGIQETFLARVLAHLRNWYNEGF